MFPVLHPSFAIVSYSFNLYADYNAGRNGKAAKTKKIVRTVVSFRGGQSMPGQRDHRTHRYKRYSPSGISPADRSQQQELLELLQLLNGNRNDLDPLGNYLLASEGRNNERDVDALDTQPDLMGQALRNSLPADLFDQTGYGYPEPEVDPEFISERGEGNELPNAYNVYKQRQQQDIIFPTHGKQVSPDPARIRLTSPIWGRMDDDEEDVMRDDPPENDSDSYAKRLAALYEVLLRNQMVA